MHQDRIQMNLAESNLDDIFADEENIPPIPGQKGYGLGLVLLAITLVQIDCQIATVLWK